MVKSLIFVLTIKGFSLSVCLLLLFLFSFFLCVWGGGLSCKGKGHSSLLNLRVLESLIKLIQLIQLILERVGDRNNDNLLVGHNYQNRRRFDKRGEGGQGFS